MDEPTRLIVVPADDAEEARVVEFPDGAGYSDIRELVGGTVADQGRYDRDAVIWVDGDGANNQQPPNWRITRYVWGHSAAAAQHRTNPDDPPNWFYGPAVITDHAYDTPPSRFFTHFGIDPA